MAEHNGRRPIETAPANLSERIPTAIAESTLEISGVTLHCFVLDDGRRVIRAEDCDALAAAWFGGKVLTEGEAAALARWF